MDLLKSYKKLCKEREWEPDRSHLRTLSQLEEIFSQFTKGRQWYNRWKTNVIPYQGIYIWGSVGRGKTFLMDFFFNEVSLRQKERWHFTEFMQMVHQLLAEFSHSSSQQNPNTLQPIILVAQHLAKNYQLICLDEFQVTEIGDAMILSRLFNQLIESNVFVVATSNKSPTELYRGGLHYDRFYSFVELIQNKWKVLQIKNEQDQDYRRQKESLAEGSDLKSIYDLQIQFRETVHREGHKSGDFIVYKRHITFPHATPTTLWVKFSELCEQAYGAAEYQAISQFYKTIYLIDVPQMGPQNRNETQRFITLVDCLYDNNVRLFLQSNYPPDQLYKDTGPQALPFERTASRLIQMQGKELLK